MRIWPTIFLLLGAWVLPAVAQDVPEAQRQRFEALLPAQKLGARVRAVDRTIGVIPIAVVVMDEASFIDAISNWTASHRYPVLLDDGTPRAREGIARFVAAFQPVAVVRWQAEADARPRREAMEGAILRSWGVELAEGQAAMPALIARWRELGAPPPGVVVTGEHHAAWTAALALATARMQPIVWLSAPGGINQTIESADADAFCKALEDSLTALGLQWRGLGDEIDAVTLCMNAPARVVGPIHGTTALTDRVGRHGSAAREAPRWAWCGHIFGGESQASLSAMASIFLSAGSAWLFDSYPSDPPWSAYALAPAGDVYRQLGLGVTINAPRAQGVDHFLRLAGEPIEAGLVAMNTKGRLAEFHLSPGRASARDVPILSSPAAAYIVHSFSAQSPGVRTSVAGAWLDRGVFAYIGSVDEPGLQSFLPQVTFAARLGSLYPFGAAGREDGMLDNRKLAVFGDPLWMLDPQGPRRLAEMPPLEGVDSFESLASRAIDAGDLGEGAWLLRMASRRELVVDLALATLRDEPARVDETLAEASIHALFEAGQRRAVAAMFARLPTERRSDPAIEDLAWHALRPLLSDRETAATMARLLSAHVRTQRLADDARELSAALAASGLRGEAATILRDALGRVRSAQERNQLEAALAGLGG